jgi:hypothetical protein
MVLVKPKMQWQKANELTRLIYIASSNTPRCFKYKLTHTKYMLACSFIANIHYTIKSFICMWVIYYVIFYRIHNFPKPVFLFFSSGLAAVQYTYKNINSLCLSYSLLAKHTNIHICIFCSVWSARCRATLPRKK